MRYLVGDLHTLLTEKLNLKPMAAWEAFSRADKAAHRLSQLTWLFEHGEDDELMAYLKSVQGKIPGLQAKLPGLWKLRGTYKQRTPEESLTK
jgi:hypothetical protein